MCAHLFLNPLFDMVKCLPILRCKPSFPVLLITNALLTWGISYMLNCLFLFVLIMLESDASWRRGGVLK